MKNIVVPIDFSPAALNACVYALGLAQHIGAALKVVHAYSGSFDNQQGLIVRAGMGRSEAVEAQMEEFVALASTDSGAVLSAQKVEAVSVHGQTIPSILAVVQELEESMIVMATSGAGNAVNRLLGSTATAVAQQATCPVLLVPPQSNYRPFNRILYASNSESVQAHSLKQFSAFAELFQPTVHFVHITDNDRESESLRQTVLNQLFQEQAPSFAFELHRISATGSLWQSLQDYATSEQMDLLLLVNRQGGFWHNLLGNSLTQRMTHSSQLPLLITHFGASAN
ncbi:MAG: universal stress protein [Bacteroidota bacterium]